MLPKIEEMCVGLELTVSEVLKVIDKNAQGICFVLDYDRKFIGVITDGDIRRGLIKGSTLSTNIESIVNRNAFSLPYTTTTEEIQKNLSSAVRHIPLLDENRRPVDYACAHRLHRIPVMEPLLGGNELAYVTDCIKTGWISSKGNYVLQFEEQLAKLCDTTNAIAVSNGTVALHLALEALGIGKGDEVIVPDFTFAASINAILYTGAIPVIVDITPEIWSISLEEVKKAITPKTKAIMPVHIYGHPCEMDELMAIAQKHNLMVIEDCAEALGSTYKGRPIGSFGDAATFSFFGNKVITTGEGGMVVFKKPEHHNLGKILRDHGMSPEKRYWHEVVGYNYRMTNLQAAIGVAQMEQLEQFLEKRKSMAETYTVSFKKVSGIKPQHLREWATSCNWLYTLLLDDSIGVTRDELIHKLLQNGIETRPTFYCLHEMPLYQPYAVGREFPNSQYVSRRGISLPSSVTLDSSEIKKIADRICSIIELKNISK